MLKPHCDIWKTSTKHQCDAEAEFHQWLFIHLSGVLFADKAGELLMLRAGQFDLSVDQQIAVASASASSWNYSLLTLCHNSECGRLIIYDRQKVTEALSDVPRWVFDELGYAQDIDPVTFLKEVGLRWRENGKIPDEIGLALGYPIKDVLGYMGMVSLPCTGVCGWRVYGDLKPSLQMSLNFEQAKQQAAAVMMMVSAG